MSLEEEIMIRVLRQRLKTAKEENEKLKEEAENNKQINEAGASLIMDNARLIQCQCKHYKSVEEFEQYECDYLTQQNKQLELELEKEERKGNEWFQNAEFYKQQNKQLKDEIKILKQGLQ